jgi:glycopeptide antibiotics resistance protein
VILVASAVKWASLLLFSAQSIFFFSIGSIDDLAAVIFVLFLNLGLLLPLLFVRASKPHLNVALLCGLGFAALVLAWITKDVFTATNSTAALGFLLVPFLQAGAIIFAACIGYAAETDRKQR